MAEISRKGGCQGRNSSKRWMLWLKFLKKVVALAEIPLKGGCYG